MVGRIELRGQRNADTVVLRLLVGQAFVEVHDPVVGQRGGLAADARRLDNPLGAVADQRRTVRGGDVEEKRGELSSDAAVFQPEATGAGARSAAAAEAGEDVF